MEQAPRSGRSYTRAMPRRPLLAIVAAVALSCGACYMSASRVSTIGPEAAPRPGTSPRDGGAKIAVPLQRDQHPGVSLYPLRIREFIFGPPFAHPEIQSGTEQLIDLLSPSPRLHVAPLPSPPDTAAIDLMEDSLTDQTWGELMTPAQRRIFEAFARDESMGAFLVIVDDVNVTDGPDPIPMTAYRWSRADVERYARCGIPPTGIDECTRDFYRIPEMLLVLPKAHVVPD